MIILTKAAEYNSMILPALLLGIVGIVLGIYFIKRPKESWRRKHHRYTEGGKPSEYYVITEKIKGVFVIIMGILMIAIALLLTINIFWPIFR